MISGQLKHVAAHAIHAKVCVGARVPSFHESSNLFSGEQLQRRFFCSLLKIKYHPELRYLVFDWVQGQSRSEKSLGLCQKYREIALTVGDAVRRVVHATNIMKFGEEVDHVQLG